MLGFAFMETKNPIDISIALRAFDTSAILPSSLIILRWSGKGIAVYEKITTKLNNGKIICKN